MLYFKMQDYKRDIFGLEMCNIRGGKMLLGDNFNVRLNRKST